VGNRQWQAARPLLTSGARRPAAIISACCLAVTVVLGVLTAHSARPDGLDGTVDSWIERTFGVHHRALLLLEDIGKPAETVILTLVIVLACLAARRLNGAVLTAVSVAASLVLTEVVLKPAVGRTLDGYRVYPSGHTGFAVTLAAVIAVLLVNPPRRQLRRALKIAVAAGAALIGSAVGVAMVGLHAHYFTDTIGGAALAIGVVLTTALVLDTERLRRWMRIASRGDHPAADMKVTTPDITTGSRKTH
jgi:membrane-associated phospholipid phosphatase